MDMDAGVGMGWPPPRGDLVPALGTAQGIDIATWNLENFPAGAATPALVADLITSLDLDLIAVQEIADVAAFDELVARLPAHEGVLSEHVYFDGAYQKVGFIYRIDVLAPLAWNLLFTDDGYSFPRPPLAVHFEVIAEGPAQGLDFVAIAVHLKAGREASDADRRQRAITLLELHVREMVEGPGDDDVIVLGDFNEPLTTAASQEIWAPLIDQPDRYAVHTTALQAGAFSFLPGQRLLDHVVTTTALQGQLAESMTIIPRLDEQISGYESSVSDHLPVMVQMPDVLE